jgi:hypothetical protein
MQAHQTDATGGETRITPGPGATAPGLFSIIPEITNIRVVNVSSLFSEDDLELFQDEVENRWTWGDTTMSLVPITDVRDVAFELSILKDEHNALDDEIFVNLNE